MNSLLLIVILLPMLAGILCYITGKKSELARNAIAILSVTVSLVLAILMVGKDLSLSYADFCGVGLCLKSDSFRGIMVLLASFLWWLSLLFSPAYFSHSHKKDRYYLFTLLTQGATMGVFLSGDLGSFLVFFEIMSFTSYVMVKQEETPAALRAGQTYLAIAVIGGLCALTGLFLLQSQFGTLNIEALKAAIQGVEYAKLFPAGILLLIGFGAKAGLFPLHIWLPEAHPAAPAPASALLSGILTKAGVFGILILCVYFFVGSHDWGMMLIILAAINMVLGGLVALFSTDIKRLLAGSSLSQIGFIVLGLGMFALPGFLNLHALWGTLLHVLNHGVIKTVLFLSVGAVYMERHSTDINTVRGAGRGKPVLLVCFVIAALGLMGVPGFSGYTSKTLLHEGILEIVHHLAHEGADATFYQILEWAFLLSGGLTTAYLTKLFVALFVEKPAACAHEKKRLPLLNCVALIVPALLVLIGGILPNLTMDGIAAFESAALGVHEHMHVHYFIWANLKGSVISLTLGFAIYFLVVRLWLTKGHGAELVYINRIPAWLSMENSLYRPILVKVLPFIGALVARVIGSLGEWATALCGKLLRNREKLPGEDANFGSYPEKPFLRRGFSATLAFSFVLLLICVVVSLLFLYFTHA